LDAWQEQKRREKEMGLTAKKPPKNWKECKERKETQKRKSYVKGLLKD
jgi:hypothetical protein